MTRQEFMKVSAVITSAFSISFTPEKVELWFQNMMDLDYNKVELALKKLIRTHDGVLTIASIIKAYDSIGEDAKSNVDALAILNKAREQYGIYRPIEALEYIKEKDETVYEVVKAIGIIEIFKGNPSFIRPEFERLYTEAGKARFASNALPASLKMAIAGFRSELMSSNLAAIGADCD